LIVDRTSILEDLLQFLYLTPVGVVQFRANGNVDMMNPVASALLLSITPADTLQNIYTGLTPLVPELPDVVARFAGPAGIILDQQWLTACAGGKAIVLSLSVNQIKHDVYMAVLTDVTRLANQEQKLRADRQKFFAIFDHVREYAIYTVTMDGIIEEWNESVRRFGGWLAIDVQGQSMGLFFPRDDPNRPRIDRLLAEAQRIGSVETEGWRIRRDGSRLWANSIITALPDESGTVRGFVVVSRDMTKRKWLEDDLKLLAAMDPLTGAYNRRQGDALLLAEFSRRARDKRPFVILMLDIDQFKPINDQHGHQAGDAVLRTLVKVCQDALRKIDMVIRWGGEEFLVIMPMTDEAGALSAAQRLITALSATEITVDPGGAIIRFTVSIGVAMSSKGDATELIHRADRAMYAAKAAGRNRVILAPVSDA
jgi:diguanylate cyclase (GGDEF)-like protein/PAS domain S-box-containing protein